MNYIYTQTEEIIRNNFRNRLSLHKTSRDIYMDGHLFDIASFRNEVFKQNNIVLSKDKYIYELTYLQAKENVFSPIEDYLNLCLAKHPVLDYESIFREMAKDVLHIDPDSLEAKYLYITLVAAVKRIYEPGCQHDTVLILRSNEQGLYKTSFFEALASQKLFTTATLDYSKDDLMKLHAKWIIELGECEETIKPYKVAKLKSFITTREDSYRKPYDKNLINAPRQFILVGTTNVDKFLYDSTGNRRFLVIDINQKINIEWVKQNRDLIWAAAVKAYKNDYPTYLNETEQQLSNSSNTKYQAEDIWQEPVTKWALEQKEPFTLSDVLIQALGLPLKSWNRTQGKRVKEILKSLGFVEPGKTNTRVNGKSGKYYQPPTSV